MHRSFLLICLLSVLVWGCAGPDRDRGGQSGLRSGGDTTELPEQTPAGAEPQEGGLVPGVDPPTAPEVAQTSPQEPTELEIQEVLEAEAVLAIADMRPSGELADWEAFAKRFAATSFRQEAGQRIEELADPAYATALREHMAPYVAKATSEGRNAICALQVVVVSELERPNVGVSFAFKDGDYNYRASNSEMTRDFAEGADFEVLRYLAPKEAVVMRIKESTLLGPIGDLKQEIHSCFWRAAGALGHKYLESRFMALGLPHGNHAGQNDVYEGDLFTPGETPEDVRRLYLHLGLDANGLMEALTQLSQKNRDWALGRMNAQDFSPSDPKLRATHAILSADWSTLTNLGSGAKTIAQAILQESHPDNRGLGACGLVVLDPTGNDLAEILAGDAERRASVLEGFLEHPELCHALETTELQAIASQARRTLQGQLQGPLPEARIAAQRLSRIEPKYLSDTDAIRLRLLTTPGALEEGLTLETEENVGHLLEILANDSISRAAPIVRSLKGYADAHGQSAVCNAQIRTNPRLRSRLRSREVSQYGGLSGLFDAHAKRFLNDVYNLTHLRALAQEDSSWRPVAREWAADAAGRSLLDYLGENKISVTAHGGGLFQAHLTITTESDHTLRIVDAPGLLFVSGNRDYQDMATRENLEAFVNGKSPTKLTVAVSCVDFGKKIPKRGNGFTMSRVPKGSQLERFFHSLAGLEARSDVIQAAVWILSDGVGIERLTQPSWVNTKGQSSSVIDYYEIIQSMKLLHDTGFDIRQFAVWSSRETLLKGAPDSPVTSWLQSM